MSLRALVIAFDDIDNTQRALIHAAVKANADSWWHHFENLWLVRTELRAGQWRDLLRPFLLKDSSVLVLTLSAAPGGRWASGGLPPSAMEWLREELPSAKSLAARPKSD